MPEILHFFECFPTLFIRLRNIHLKFIFLQQRNQNTNGKFSFQLNYFTLICRDFSVRLLCSYSNWPTSNLTYSLESCARPTQSTTLRVNYYWDPIHVWISLPRTLSQACLSWKSGTQFTALLNFAKTLSLFFRSRSACLRISYSSAYEHGVISPLAPPFFKFLSTLSSSNHTG